MPQLADAALKLACTEPVAGGTSAKARGDWLNGSGRARGTRGAPGKPRSPCPRGEAPRDGRRGTATATAHAGTSRHCRSPTSKLGHNSDKGRQFGAMRQVRKRRARTPMVRAVALHARVRPTRESRSSHWPDRRPQERAGTLRGRHLPAHVGRGGVLNMHDKRNGGKAAGAWALCHEWHGMGEERVWAKPSTV